MRNRDIEPTISTRFRLPSGYRCWPKSTSIRSTGLSLSGTSQTQRSPRSSDVILRATGAWSFMWHVRQRPCATASKTAGTD
jgi:hypothetical protein